MTTEPTTYTTCFELPLYNFIQISLYGIQEKWGVEPDAWEDIVNQYSELSGDKSMSQIFTLTRQVTFLTNKLNIIQLIVSELAKKRTEGFIEILKTDLGFNFNFTDLQRDLERVVSRSKADLVKLKLAEKQLEQLQSGSGESATEADWNDELAVLGKYQGYALRPKEVSVAEYLAVKKQLRHHVEQQNKINKH